jgi:hypothetical protein
MRHLKLFESFILEAENTNLEIKSIFKRLVNELRKMNLKVKFEYKKFSKGEFDKFIPSKNLYDQGDDAYFVMNDDDPEKGYIDTSYMKLFFSPNIDRQKAKAYVENVKNFIDTAVDKEAEPLFRGQVEAEVFEGPSVGLLVKPVFGKNKTQMEYSMGANKFMGLKRSPVRDNISYLVGSGFKYISDQIEKTKEFQLIKIDDNTKTVEIDKGLSYEISKSDMKDKLVSIAKKFANKIGYRYNPISNSFE